MLNISQIIGKFVKNSSQREIEKLKSIIVKINNWEKKIENIPDSDFPLKTKELKLKFQKKTRLDDLLPEAFALVREASKRVRKERHFDVQIIGGIVLQAFGHMPERGEQLEISDLNFEVLNADSRRVRLLRVNTNL